MTKRMTFDFPDPAHARLERLKEITESSNYADVVRNSLKLYEWIILETEAGKDFFMKAEDGEVSRIPIFLDNLQSTPRTSQKKPA